MNSGVMCSSFLYVAMYAKDITTNKAKSEAKRLLEVSELPDNKSVKNFFIMCVLV
jgi:hypothetical protein